MDDSKKKPRLNSLVIEGVKYMTIIPERYKNRKPYKEKDPNEIRSFIPGTIAELMVKPGKKVEIGDVLLILEAMKMRNVIVSPVAGKIRKIYVKPDQMVPKDFLMLDIEQ